jgi:hypothetical protein
LAREAQLIFSNVQGFNMGESLRIWRGKIKAGNNQEYQFEFVFPHGYPNQRPLVKSLTPMNHPNLARDGTINLDILDRWRPEFHGYQVLLQLISLLKRSPPHGAPSQSSFPRDEPVATRQYSAQPVTSRQPDFQNFKRSTSSEINIAPRGGSAGINQQEAQESAVLKKQMSQMREQLTKQEEELTRIRARNAIGIGTNTEIAVNKKASKDLQDTFKNLNTSDQINELESEQIAISELMTGLQEKHQAGEISIFDYSKLYKKYSRDLYILRKKLEYVREHQK